MQTVDRKAGGLGDIADQVTAYNFPIMVLSRVHSRKHIVTNNRVITVQYEKIRRLDKLQAPVARGARRTRVDRKPINMHPFMPIGE